MIPDDLTVLADAVEGIASWCAGHIDEPEVSPLGDLNAVAVRLRTLADQLRPEWRLVVTLPDGTPFDTNDGPTTDPERVELYHDRAAKTDYLAVQIRYVPRHRGGWTTITPEEQP